MSQRFANLRITPVEDQHHFEDRIARKVARSLPNPKVLAIQRIKPSSVRV